MCLVHDQSIHRCTKTLSTSITQRQFQSHKGIDLEDIIKEIVAMYLPHKTLSKKSPSQKRIMDLTLEARGRVSM
jgi:hypothetical protein